MAPISLSTVNGLRIVAKRYVVSSYAKQCRSIPCLSRSFSDNQHETTSVHFRATTTPHPLATKANNLKASRPIPTISGLDKDGNPLVEVFIEQLMSTFPIEYLILRLFPRSALRSGCWRSYRPSAKSHLERGGT